MSELDVSKLKVTELRTELSKRSLSTKGKKEELVARLNEALQAQSSQANEEETAPEEIAKQVAEPEESAPEKVTEPKEAAKDTKDVEEVVEQTKEAVAIEESVQEAVAIEESVQEVVAIEESVQEVVQPEETKEEIVQPEKIVEEKKQVVEEQTVTTVVEEKTVNAEGVVVDESTNVMETATKATVVEETPAVPVEESNKAIEAVVEEEASTAPVEEIKENAAVVVKATKEETVTVEVVKEETSIKRKREEESNEDQASSDAISSALYVKGFIRPLIIRQVQELFSKYGTVKRFWMDSIKTHAYVIYENEEQARDAHQHIHGIRFPPETGKELSVGHLTPEATEKLIEYEQNAAERCLKVDWEEAIQKIQSGQDLPLSENARKLRAIGIGQITKQLAQAVEPVREERPQKEQKKELLLDDLFRKTTTLPHLYYLPNTDEEAKIKLQKL